MGGTEQEKNVEDMYQKAQAAAQNYVQAGSTGAQQYSGASGGLGGYQVQHTVCPTCGHCPTCGNYRATTTWTGLGYSYGINTSQMK